MRTKDQGLAVCTTCGHDVEPGQLGLKDYRWLRDVLPAKVGGADLDFVLEQASTGRVLILEFKPESRYIPTGQRLLLKAFVRMGCDVWVVHELPGGRRVVVGEMGEDGNVGEYREMFVGNFRQRVGRWWNEGLREN